MAKAQGGKVTIKKYANRRLYDTDSSAYITLDKLATMIRDGRDFEVIDAKSGEDITHQVLTQIIADEEAGGSTLLPVNFLRQIIGLYGGSMQAAVPTYLEAAMEAFEKNQSAMRGALEANPLAEIAKRNMALFESAAGVLTPKAAKPQTGGTSEVEALKAELAALQAKVDKLGK